MARKTTQRVKEESNRFVKVKSESPSQLQVWVESER